MSEVKSRGLLICVEGIDGSGKTTLCKNLKQIYDMMYPEKSVVMSFPSKETIIGKNIRTYLANKEKEKIEDEKLALLFALDRFLMRQQLIKELREGKTVFVDRYTLSGIAYAQALLNENEKDWVMSINSFDIKPDLIIYLDIDIEIAGKRKIEKCQLYDRDIKFLKKVQSIYHHLIDTNPFELSIIKLDGRLDIETLVHLVLDEIEKTRIKHYAPITSIVKKEKVDKKIKMVFKIINDLVSH